MAMALIMRWAFFFDLPTIIFHLNLSDYLMVPLLHLAFILKNKQQ